MNRLPCLLILSLGLALLLGGCASTREAACSCTSCHCGTSDDASPGKCTCGPDCACANPAPMTIAAVEELVLLPDADQIRGVMSAQQDAWNRGDLNGFMEGYWESDELVFTSGDRIRRGWQATLDAYKKNYRPETMGKLAFTDLEIVKTADNEAVVSGRWQLTEREGNPSGGFTLVFRRLDEGWRIVRDHTSSD